jgi:hypothetical protein
LPAAGSTQTPFIVVFDDAQPARAAVATAANEMKKTRAPRATLDIEFIRLIP